MDQVEPKRGMAGLLLVVALIALMAFPHLFAWWIRPSQKKPLKTVVERAVPNQNNTKAQEEPSQRLQRGTTSSSNQSNDQAQRMASTTDEPPSISNNNNSLGKSSTSTISQSSNWQCACEGGFLPPGLLQSLGGAEAVMRMSAGQCYHKQK